MHSFLRRVSVALIVLSIGGSAASGADILYFTSTPGSWIGQGQTKWLESPTSHFTSRRFFAEGSHTNAVRLDGGDYELTIVGSHYTLPAVGFYGNATRWPFQENGVGMDFTGAGNGDNQISGYFNVLQADYTSNGDVQSFAVDFFQYDETQKIDYTAGSFRFNSNVPVPEASLFGLILCIAGLALLSSRKPVAENASRRLRTN